MASMGFTTRVVWELMNLVDDNKEKVCEADYIEICNAVKYLHDSKTYTPSSPTSTYRNPFHSLTHRQQSQLLSIENHIDHARTDLYNTTTQSGRVINIDRYNVLKTFGYEGPILTIELKNFENMMLVQERFTKHTFKIMCVSQKTIRLNEHTTVLRIKIRNLIQCRERIIQQIQRQSSPLQRANATF